MVLLFGVGVLCWVLVLWFVSLCHFKLSNNLAEEENAGCFTLNVLWLSQFCVSSSTNIDPDEVPGYESFRRHQYTKS